MENAWNIQMECVLSAQIITSFTVKSASLTLPAVFNTVEKIAQHAAQVSPLKMGNVLHGISKI
jgi:hypothetical protein